MRNRIWLVLALTLLANPATAFDLTAYAEFLEQNSQLDYSALRDRHEPVPHHLSDLMLENSGMAYLQEVSDAYNLTEDELSLLAQNGFVVSERLVASSYGELLNSIWTQDLPLFISSDLILHALHISYLGTQKTTELNYIVPELMAALEAAHATWPVIAARYAGIPQMQPSLQDLDIWLTVARTLLSGTRVTAATLDSEPMVNEVLTKIEDLQPSTVGLFNTDARLIDFSQFQPRGYYTESLKLQRYFRCMMWLGRVEFRFTIPPGEGAPASVQREVVDAFLIRELLIESGSRETIEDIERVLRLFIGLPDNNTLADLDQISAEMNLDSADQLLDASTYAMFNTVLDMDIFQPQAINSRILMADPTAAEPMQMPYAFLMLGQRFTVDSHVLGNVVFDKVPSPPFRGMPSPLDVLYALGNDDVVGLLKAELNTYGYAPNLGAVRHLVDSYDEQFWSSSLYNHWISAIRTLSHTGTQHGAPDFMRTGAWQQKEMQTQLTSWSELRHDTVLYAKQSYSGGIICSNPHGYIEPVPALYRRIGALSQFFVDQISPHLPASSTLNWLVNFWGRVATVMSKLETIADKELAHVALSPEEELFLREAYSREHLECGDFEAGWLESLFWAGGSPDPLQVADLVVADVHTQPTDEGGSLVGKVLHVGTIRPRLGVFIAGCPSSSPVAYVGPVGSMRQYVSVGFDRLTDEEWRDAWLDNGTWPPNLFMIPALSSAPWERIYTADSDGLRQTGPSILNTYSVAIGEPEIPTPRNPRRPGIAWLQNSPNPFNPKTQIGFELVGDRAVPVRVAIYDARGALVRVLLNDSLQPNTWFIPWDGTDDAGRRVSSGVYFTVVLADGQRTTQKMVMVR